MSSVENRSPSLRQRAIGLLPERAFRILRSLGRQTSNVSKPIWFREPLETELFLEKAFAALAFNQVAGDYLEFGCHSGNTFTLAYESSRRYGSDCKLWAFDSFCGLPPEQGPEDAHPRWTAGSMSTSLADFHAILRRRRVPESAYRVAPGFYEDTLTSASDVDLPGEIAMVYVDCDLYSSTKTVLEYVTPRLKQGVIVAFDDYFCYSTSQVSGERRACVETFRAHPRWRLVPFIQYGYFGQSFIVEDKRLLAGELESDASATSTAAFIR